MRVAVIAVSTFLLLCAGPLSPVGAQTAATQGDSGDLASAGAQIPVNVIQLSRGIADFAQQVGTLFAPRGPQPSSRAPTPQDHPDRSVSQLRRYPE